MLSHEQIVDLIPAYALDALDEQEASTVKEHLEACPSCRTELRAYQVIASSMPLAVPQYQPPARVKTALMERVAASQSESQPQAAPQPAPQAAPSWLERFNAFLRGGFGPLRLAGLAAILVLLASNLLLWRQVADLRAAQPEMLGVINLTPAGNDPYATGVIIVSADRSHGTLVVDNLRLLPEDQQYQLWLVKDSYRVSGGVFSVDDEGYGALWVHSDEPLGNFTSFGITIEPHGGSEYPTGERVLMGGL